MALGCPDCTKVLLQGGCDANAINQDGWNGTFNDILSDFDSRLQTLFDIKLVVGCFNEILLNIKDVKRW